MSNLKFYTGIFGLLLLACLVFWMLKPVDKEVTIPTAQNDEVVTSSSHETTSNQETSQTQIENSILQNGNEPKTKVATTSKPNVGVKESPANPVDNLLVKDKDYSLEEVLVQVKLGNSEYKVGDTVNYEYTIQNKSAVVVNYIIGSSSCPQNTVKIDGVNPNENSMRACTMDYGTTDIKPGESKTFKDRFNLATEQSFAKPGTHDLTVTVKVSEKEFTGALKLVVK